MMTTFLYLSKNINMNIDSIEYHGENIWNCDKRLFSTGSIARSVGTFSSFNTCEHVRKVYYYAPSGYVVKFIRQAILQSTVSNSCDLSKTYRVCYFISIRNVNCKKETYQCRYTCPDVDGTIIINHRNNYVTSHLCETNYPDLFYGAFYETLRDFITENPSFEQERVQVYMCKQRDLWINNELLDRLYSVFNNGQVFVASN